MSGGWRTVVVQGTSRITIASGQLIITDLELETSRSIPLGDIGRLLLMQTNGLISIEALRQLSLNDVGVILCSKRYMPMAELSAYNMHDNAAGAVIDQASWTPERKQFVWRSIIKNKIRNQIQHLHINGIQVPGPLYAYARDVKPGDPSNREGQAARIYFRLLFGNGFRRHAPDAVNAALNFGYSLLTSCFSRVLAMHGYNTALGIHHDNRRNRYNLACDLMESFRPFVDQAVYDMEIKRLDSKTKNELIQLIYRDCIYKGRNMNIDQAIETYTLDIMKLMSEEQQFYTEIKLKI